MAKKKENVACSSQGVKQNLTSRKAKDVMASSDVKVTERKRRGPKPKKLSQMVTMYRRVEANARERMRQGEINKGFEVLRERIPHPVLSKGGKCEKLRKIDILHVAISYIRALENILEKGEAGINEFANSVYSVVAEQHRHRFMEDEDGEEVDSNSGEDEQQPRAQLPTGQGQDLKESWRPISGSDSRSTSDRQSSGDSSDGQSWSGSDDLDFDNGAWVSGENSHDQMSSDQPPFKRQRTSPTSWCDSSTSDSGSTGPNLHSTPSFSPTDRHLQTSHKSAGSTDSWVSSAVGFSTDVEVGWSGCNGLQMDRQLITESFASCQPVAQQHLNSNNNSCSPRMYGGGDDLKALTNATAVIGDKRMMDEEEAGFFHSLSDGPKVSSVTTTTTGSPYPPFDLFPESRSGPAFDAGAGDLGSASDLTAVVNDLDLPDDLLFKSCGSNGFGMFDGFPTSSGLEEFFQLV